MQAMAPSGMPATRIVEGGAKGKRDFGSHQHERLPLRIRALAQRLRQEHHRRNADAAADQQRARPLRVRHEAVADRPERADPIAARFLRDSNSSPGPTIL